MTEVVNHRKPLKGRFFKTILRKRVEKVEPQKFKWRRLPQMVLYGAFRLIAELTAIILGLAALWFCAFNSLMAQQSVDISGLKPNAQMWFSEAFNGSAAQIGDMNLTWLPASNTILFEAFDVVVTDKQGAKIETMPRLQTEISMDAAIKGYLIPSRIVIDGGTVTWLRDKKGKLIAGLGTPNTVGKFGPIWRGAADNSNTSADISTIETITITNATAYIIDNVDGLDLTLNDTDINFSQNEQSIEIDMISVLQKNQVSIPLKLDLKISSDLKDYTLDIETSGLNPSIISPKRGRYSGLKDFDAALDIKANFDVDRDQGVRLADVDIKAGKGHVKFGEFETKFDVANLAAILSAESQNMDITSIGLTSKNFAFSGAGTLSELGAMTDGNINSSPVFDLIFKDVMLDRTPSLAAPLKFSEMEMLGRLDLDARRLTLDRMRANLGHYEYDLSGTFAQNEAGKWSEIVLKGHANGTLTPKDLLSIWPVKFAKGARDWIEKSILKASLNNLTFDGVFDEETFRTGIPKDENLTLAIDIADADVSYIQTMTHYTNVSGRVVLSGNSVRFDTAGGNVGNLTISTGTVEIPILQPRGGDIVINLQGSGTTSEMLTLVNQKPFEFATKFGVEPEGFGGTGVIDMKITRPLLVVFPPDQIKYDISGTFSDVTAPIQIGPHKIKNGNITLTADSAGMTLLGPVDIGPWQTNLNWRKEFDFGKTPTRYEILGKMDRDTLDSFGVGFREYFEGDIALKIDAIGNGLNFTSAEVTADLKDTGIQIGEYWSKTKGTAGEFNGHFKRGVDGSIQFEAIDIVAPGLNVSGRVAFENNFKLIDLDLSTTKISGLIDASVQIKPDTHNEKLSIFVIGDFLNVSQAVSNALSNSKAGIDVPILLTANLKSLALNEAYVVNNANLLLSHDGTGPINARLEAQTKEGPLKLQILSSEEGQAREVIVNIPSASVAAQTFLGLDSIEGGQLKITAELPPIGKVGALSGVAEIDKFKLVRAPIFAQMLSIGSLTGIVDTFSGEGLNFDTFYVPFSLRDGELNIRNARVSGPALGMTGDGEIRFKDRLVDLDGTLVPAYTANSLLGDIPLIGDIFVGKKGEGIFALSYTIQGEFDEVQVAVNPLSALTPGFLRGIFKPKRNKLSEDVLAEIKAVAPN